MPLQKFEMPEEPDWDNINWDKSEMSKEEAMAMWKQQAEQMKQLMEEYSKWVEDQKAQGVEFDENITEQKKILVIESSEESIVKLKFDLAGQNTDPHKSDFLICGDSSSGSP